MSIVIFFYIHVTVFQVIIGNFFIRTRQIAQQFKTDSSTTILYCSILLHCVNWGVAVQIPVGSRMFTSPYRPDRLLGSPLSNGYRGLFPQGKAARDMKLTIHTQLVQRSRKRGLYIHSPICLHGTKLSWLSTERALALPCKFLTVALWILQGNRFATGSVFMVLGGWHM
jgi:hypothetical protein